MASDAVAQRTKTGYEIADWLEVHGQKHKAEHIRGMCRSMTALSTSNQQLLRENLDRRKQGPISKAVTKEAHQALTDELRRAAGVLDRMVTEASAMGSKVVCLKPAATEFLASLLRQAAGS